MTPLLTNSLIVALTLTSILLAAAWLLSGQVIKRRKPDSLMTPDALGLEYEQIWFTSRDGLILDGRLAGNPNAESVIIFCAGMFGSMDGDTAMLPLFIKEGFTVFQFDWRGHGESEGDRNTLSIYEIDDLRGAIDHLQGWGFKRIGLMGFSMGGAVALRAAASDERIACVICDGGFVHIENAIFGYARQRVRLPIKSLLWLTLRFVEIRLGRRVSEASPLPHIEKISPRPVMFIYGSDDPVVSRHDQDAIVAACREPKTLWRIESIGHRQAHRHDPEGYYRRVLGFFRSGL